MPRIRTLKPEITTDEKLARVSRDARLTFILAITQADDDGLLPGNARQLMAALYPMDETVTDRILTYWLKELAEIGVVRWRETRQGAPVLEIVKWADHQRVDHKGKSLLRPNIRELGENVEPSSRESRESLANDSRSDLGPRTVDLGPRSIAPDGDAKARKPPREPRPPRAESWVTEGVALWQSIVGTVPHGEFGAQLKPMVDLHGWPAVRPDMEKWLRDQVAAGKGCKPAWYAGAVSARLAKKPPIVNEHGELTDYGERITRPGKVPA